jgi:NAD(P)-dependent dehydrogenase (short-subunit alcohol dehydrogenase family)
VSRLAVVSGGSRGLGKALTEQFLAEGWEVLEFSRSGGGPGHVSVDLSTGVACLPVFGREFGARAGRPYEELVLVNNAGSLEPIRMAADLDPAGLAANLNVNFTAQVVLIQQFVRAFAGHRGRKVVANVSSGAALKGYPGWSLYCAGKAGMENFIRALAEEEKCRPCGFTFLNFDPYVMDTAMQATIRQTDPVDFPPVARFVGYRENGRLLPPSTVARCLLQVLYGPIDQERYEAAQLLAASAAPT